MGCREICFGAWNIFFPPSSVALIFPGWLLFLPPSLLTLLVWHFPFLKHFLRGSLSLAGGAQLCPVADGLELLEMAMSSIMQSQPLLTDLHCSHCCCQHRFVSVLYRELEVFLLSLFQSTLENRNVQVLHWITA